MKIIRKGETFSNQMVGDMDKKEPPSVQFTKKRNLIIKNNHSYMFIGKHLPTDYSNTSMCKRTRLTKKGKKFLMK